MPEYCEDCKVEHKTLDETLDSLNKQRKKFLVGYIFSIFLLIYCGYGLAGVFGAFAVVASYGMYIFQRSMRVVVEEMIALNRVKFAEIPTTHGDPNKKLEKKGFGQYV